MSVISAAPRTLPLALCRTCGWDFFMAQEGKDEVLQPWLGGRSDKSTLFLYDPPTTHLEIEEEDIPLGDDDEDVPTGASGDEQDDSANNDESDTADKFLDPRSLRLVDPATDGNRLSASTGQCSSRPRHALPHLQQPVRGAGCFDARQSR